MIYIGVQYYKFYIKLKNIRANSIKTYMLLFFSCYGVLLDKLVVRLNLLTNLDLLYIKPNKFSNQYLVTKKKKKF